MSFQTHLYIFVCIFLSGCLFAHGQGQDINTGLYQTLSDLHQKWLIHNSNPEMTRFLDLPSQSDHSNDLATGSWDSSEINFKKGFPLLGSLPKDDVDGKCSDDIIQVATNLESEWALQMLDSDGKVPEGILRGSIIWTGHYEECINVYAPLDADGHGDFHGQYCTSYWTLNLTKQYSNLPLTIGMCVPDSCTGNNIKTALKNSSYILDRFPFLKQLDSRVTLDRVVCKPKEKTLDAPAIIYLVIISIFILLSVLGSSLTLYDNWKLNSLSRRHLLNQNGSAQNYGSLQSPEMSINNSVDAENQTAKYQGKETFIKGSSAEKAALTANDDAELQAAIIQSQKQIKTYSGIAEKMILIYVIFSMMLCPVPVIKRVLLCFSIFANGQKVLNIDTAEGQLLSIHGIRFLSLTWVILGHTYISSVSIVGNRLDVLEQMDTFAFQMLLQSPFSVDSFFLLSGFLLAYLFLKEATKKKGKISWLYFYIHRIWRLTPSYLIVVFFYMLIFKYLGSGPFWPDNNCDADRSSWWKYLLYINNFIPINDMCVGWSWYLANDMQFYIISPLFLYPLWRIGLDTLDYDNNLGINYHYNQGTTIFCIQLQKWPIAGFGVLGSFLIATWTTTGIMSYTNDLIPMFVGITHAPDITAYQKRMWDSFDLIYDKPYCRIAPYIIGVILGYILHKTDDRKKFLNWWQQLLGWVIAAGCSVSVVFGLYHVEMSRTVALFYNSLCRSAFAIGLAWLIYVCETGHGGFLTKFLSWKLWIPLSRLTYSAYLVHPMLIHGYYQAYQTALHFTELIAVTNFMGFLLLSYGIAFAFSLVFESPFMNLEKLLVKRKAE